MKSKLIEYLSHKDENLLKKRKVGEAILSNFEHFLGRSKKAGRPTNEFAQPDGGAQEEVPFGKEVFRRSRPYWVKNEERSVCLCIYHLRMSGYVQVKEILSRNFRHLIKIISKFI